MSISIDRSLQHVAHWTKTLEAYPTRKSWPNFVFHTCDVSVAIEIIRQNALVSRNSAAAGTGLICDVANQGALWNNPEAHEYVRMYFRPKNMFHLKTEGIKSSTDVHRVDPHMTIPVAFAFDFSSVMTQPTTSFLSQNFAIGDTAPLQGDDAFNRLRFDLIYHDSRPPDGFQQEYLNARMAEVVSSAPVPLSMCRGIVFRNDFDIRTCHYLAESAGLTMPPSFLDTKGAVFFKRGMAIRELYLIEGGLILQFSGPHVAAKDHYTVTVRHGSFTETYPLSAMKKWQIETGKQGDQLVEVFLEDCLAFRGILPSLGTSVV